MRYRIALRYCDRRLVGLVIRYRHKDAVSYAFAALRGRSRAEVIRYAVAAAKAARDFLAARIVCRRKGWKVEL